MIFAFLKHCKTNNDKKAKKKIHNRYCILGLQNLKYLLSDHLQKRCVAPASVQHPTQQIKKIGVRNFGAGFVPSFPFPLQMRKPEMHCLQVWRPEVQGQDVSEAASLWRL